MDPVMSDLNAKIGGCFAESMSSVFSMLTGREFAIKPQDGDTLDHAGVSVLHQATVVYVKAHYTKGMTGIILFALPLKEGTMLVDLMLGGDGTPSTELAGDSRDALAETFNQIMGSANQALSDLAGETLSISILKFSVVAELDETTCIVFFTSMGFFINVGDSTHTWEISGRTLPPVACQSPI